MRTIQFVTVGLLKIIRKRNLSLVLLVWPNAFQIERIVIVYRETITKKSQQPITQKKQKYNEIILRKCEGKIIKLDAKSNVESSKGNNLNPRFVLKLHGL